MRRLIIAVVMAIAVLSLTTGPAAAAWYHTPTWYAHHFGWHVKQHRHWHNPCSKFTQVNTGPFVTDSPTCEPVKHHNRRCYTLPREICYGEPPYNHIR